jgi:hypothetical protein
MLISSTSHLPRSRAIARRAQCAGYPKGKVKANPPDEPLIPDQPPGYEWLTGHAGATDALENRSGAGRAGLTFQQEWLAKQDHPARADRAVIAALARLLPGRLRLHRGRWHRALALRRPS